jgi:hypothetical protein
MDPRKEPMELQQLIDAQAAGRRIDLVKAGAAP